MNALLLPPARASRVPPTERTLPANFSDGYDTADQPGGEPDAASSFMGRLENRILEGAGRQTRASDGMVPEETSGQGSPDGSGESDCRVSDVIPSETPSPSPSRTPSEWHLRDGLRRLAAVIRARELRAQLVPWPSVATSVGYPLATLYRWTKAVESIESPTAEDLVNRTFRNGQSPRIARLNTDEVREVRALYLATNRTASEGSLVEALTQAIKLKVLRPELAELINGRLAAGLPPLARSQLRLLRCGRPTVEGARSPRGAWLRYIKSSGALQLDLDPETGEEIHVPPGSRWTIDDGSVNLLVTVPGLEVPGDPCWEAYGVVVGRFQLLLTVDHRTRYILGRSYTCRPRDAYRAEDITSALGKCVAAFGAPREIVLEKGISAANLVSSTLEALGVKIIRANSPHEKVVESVFNVLWTSLSTLPGQIGRSRGEMEEMNRWWMACRQGRRDPRKELLSLPEFLVHLDAAIARCNDRWVDGRQGRWRPSEWWAKRPESATRSVAAENLWMFAPCISNPVKVNFHQVATSVPMVSGRSERFVFSAPWLAEWHGARVKLHFDPWAENCDAMATLAESYQGHAAGKVLGRLEQIDRLTRFTRRALCLTIEGDIGREVTSAAARQLVASVKSIGAPESSPKPSPSLISIGRASKTAKNPVTGFRRDAPAEAASLEWRDARLNEYSVELMEDDPKLSDPRP